jgi:pectin-derived oligosaccharide transport system permease protein
LRESQVIGDNLIFQSNFSRLMSDPLLICLIALSTNVAGMILIYACLALALARVSWGSGGLLPALITLIVAGQFWIAPAMLVFGFYSAGTPAAYSLWFGNWLVSAFSVAVLCLRVRSIPRALEDSARLDGCGWIGTGWHAVLPLVRRELGLIAFLTVIATGLPFWAALTIPAIGDWFPPFFGLLPMSRTFAQSNAGAFVGMMAGSLFMTLVVIALFFFAKRYFARAASI